MEKTIDVGGKAMRMRASALIPRLYRIKFGRDMIVDMRQLQKSYENVLKQHKGESEEDINDAQLSVTDLTIFENVAWLMCKHADKDSVPDSPDEWLDSIDGVVSIYEVFPQILDMWQANLVTTSIPRKK